MIDYQEMVASEQLAEALQYEVEHIYAMRSLRMDMESTGTLTDEDLTREEKNKLLSALIVKCLDKDWTFPQDVANKLAQILIEKNNFKRASLLNELVELMRGYIFDDYYQVINNALEMFSPYINHQKEFDRENNHVMYGAL